MKLTGFTDEASNDIDTQITLTKALGWEYLSARTVGDLNIHDISDDAFKRVVEKLQQAEVKVAEFGSLIGNWSKSIKSEWSVTENEIERAISRMKRLDVKFIRIMSYAQEPWGMDQHEEERFSRLRKITKLFSDEGLEALHENCMNWGGFSADHTLRLLEEVPGLRLVFDTGNPLFQKDRSKEAPYPWQDSLEFYHKIKHAIAHIHVKDAIMDENDEQPIYTFAGEGNGNLKAIMKDLHESNYDGFVAIEPHMGKVFHEANKDEKVEQQYEIYFQFAKKFENLLSSIKES